MATDGPSFEEQVRESLSHSYDIERELGGGGMSRVYVATDRSLGRKIVIKVLSPELTESVNRQRFRREIQVAAQLQHPHIVTLLSAGDDDAVHRRRISAIRSRERTAIGARRHSNSI